MSKLLKLAFIFGTYVGVNTAGYKLRDSFPRTGRSFIYLGTLVYGAGIFLIGQMFNFGGNFSTAFLLWSVGIIPLAWQQKDKYLFLFANLLFLAFLNSSLHEPFPYAVFPAIPVIYLAYNYFGKSRLLLFFANITTLNLLWFMSFRWELSGLYIAFLFFVIGLLMFFVRHPLHPDIFRLQGNIVFGVAGIVLTIPHFWQDAISPYQTEISAAFAIAFLILLFALIKNGSLVSLIFVCLTIFRYYVDTFEFLPKSIFFMAGGLLLLAFGYYFERLRKKQKGGITL